MRNQWIGKTWIPAIAGAALAATLAAGGCGDDESSSPFSPPAEGSGLGLLALQLESVGRSAVLGGEAEEAGIAGLLVTFDSIRAYPGCDDSGITDHHHGDEGGRHHGDGHEPDGGVEAPTHEGDGHDEPGEPCRGGHAPDGHYPPHEDEDGGYFEMLGEPVTVDLLDLGSGLVEVLGSLDIPAGQYRHVRLHVLEARTVTAGGGGAEVRLPGEWDDFLGVMLSFTVADGEVTELFAIMDLADSLVEDPPGSGTYVFRPVVHGEHGHDDHHHGDGDFGDHDDDHGHGGGMH